MPKKYEHIRDAYMEKGYSDKRAKQIAAATYNKQRKPGTKPVTGKHSDTKRK